MSMGLSRRYLYQYGSTNEPRREIYNHFNYPRCAFHNTSSSGIYSPPLIRTTELQQRIMIPQQAPMSCIHIQLESAPRISLANTRPHLSHSTEPSIYSSTSLLFFHMNPYSTLPTCPQPSAVLATSSSKISFPPSTPREAPPPNIKK
jgi:hypothetical protein